MPKLQEIIDLFETMGFSEARVREALAAGDSGFNAFEALKIELEIHWETLNFERQAALAEIYARLQNISMTSRTLEENADVLRERARPFVLKRHGSCPDVRENLDAIIDRTNGMLKELGQPPLGILPDKDK